MTTAFSLSWGPWAPGAYRAFAHRQNAFARAALLRDPPAALDLAPAVGQAWFPVVFERAWEQLDGCLLPVRTDGSGTRVDPALVEEVWGWIAAVAVTVPATDRPPLTVSRLPDPADVGPLAGRSYGFALAIAAISRLLGRAPAVPIVASACLGVGGSLDPVERGAAKQGVLALESPDVSLFLAEKPVPAAEVSALLIAWFGPTWAHDLAQRVQVSPERLAEDAWMAYQQRRYTAAEHLAAEAVRAGATGLAAGRARWILAARAMHAGDTDTAITGLRTAADLVHHHADPHDAEVERLDAYLGVALIDLGRPKAAIELLERANQALAHPGGRERRQAWVEVRGSLSRAYLLDGRLDDARAILEDQGPASDTPRALPGERARSCGDLAEVYRRMGDVGSAAAWLDRARNEARHMPPEYRAFTLRFIDLYAVRCGVRDPNWPIAEANEVHWPQPLEAGESALHADPATFRDWLTESWSLLTRRAHRMALCGLLARALQQWPEELHEHRRLFYDLAHKTSQADGAMEPELQACLVEAMDDPSLWIERSPY
jgi:tetratricopeptide (TPR) repeat protein